MLTKKLFRFAEVSKMEHVFEPTLEMIKNNTLNFKGNWRKEYFKNDHPIVLELGCGKGEYTIGLARKNPDKNFIGIDIKGNRIYIGAKQAMEENLHNVRFLRSKIDFIEHFFEQGEIDEIWLTFSDPQSKKPKKRLSSKLFIDRYRKMLKPKGVVHLKTDSDLLFEFTMEQIQLHHYPCLFSSEDIYRDLDKLPEEEQEILKIKTYYEEFFAEKGAIIKYCKFLID